MSSPTQSVNTIVDPTFNQLAHEVITSNSSLVVETAEKRKVVISPYIDEAEEDRRFFHLLDNLHQKTAHLSSDEQQRLADEMDEAILAERNKEREQRRATS